MPQWLNIIAAAQIEKLSGSKFFRNVAMIAGGTAIAQAITILSAPVVTRLYTPSDFGLLTVFTSIIGIIAQLSTFRYAVTIPIAETEELAENVLRLCFLVTILFSLSVGVTSFFLSDFLSSKLPVQNAVRYIWLLPACLFGAGVFDALSNWAIRQKNFKLVARTSVSKGTSSSIIKISLGALGVKPLGLLLGLLASQMAGSGSLLYSLIKSRPEFFRRFSLNGVLFAARRFSRFPLFQTWSKLLLNIGVQAPALFMAAHFGASTVGFFGLANSMINLPMNLIGASVGKVYYAETASLGKAAPSRILSLSISTIKKMVFVAAIPTGAIVMAGPWLFSTVFGSEWREAGLYARLLTPLILGRFVSAPVMHCLDVMERQVTQVALNIIRVAYVVGVFLLCHYMALSPETTILCYSIVGFIFHVCAISIVLWILFAARSKEAVERALR